PAGRRLLAVTDLGAHAAFLAPHLAATRTPTTAPHACPPGSACAAARPTRKTGIIGTGALAASNPRTNHHSGASREQGQGGRASKSVESRSVKPARPWRAGGVNPLSLPLRGLTPPARRPGSDKTRSQQTRIFLTAIPD